MIPVHMFAIPASEIAHDMSHSISCLKQREINPCAHHVLKQASPKATPCFVGRQHSNVVVLQMQKFPPPLSFRQCTCRYKVYLLIHDLHRDTSSVATGVNGTTPATTSGTPSSRSSGSASSPTAKNAGVAASERSNWLAAAFSMLAAVVFPMMM